MASVLSERGRKCLENSKKFKDPVVVRANPWSPENPDGNINLETAVNTLCEDLWREKLGNDFWDFDPEVLQYSDYAGTQKIKKALVPFITKYFGSEAEVDPRKILLFPGTSAAIDAIAFAVANKNDAIITTAPYYDKFAPICATKSGVHIISSNMELEKTTSPESETFKMKVAHFEKAFHNAVEKHQKPRAIILCNPNNPLGKAYSPEELIPILLFAEQELYDCLHEFGPYQPVPLPIQEMALKILLDFDWIDQVYLPTNTERLNRNKNFAVQRLIQMGANVHPTDSGTFVFCDFRKFLKEQTEEAELELYWQFVNAGVFMKSGKILRCPVPGWFRLVFTVEKQALMQDSWRRANPKSASEKLVEELTADQVIQFQQAFSVFDRDGDGTITIKELGVVMRSLGQNPKECELQQMINEADEDGGGTLDFNEFVVLMAKRLQETDDEEDIRESYRVFDKEKKGYIASGDLRYVLLNLHEKVSEEEVDELIKVLDKDGDGEITYSEYVDMITKK